MMVEVCHFKCSLLICVRKLYMAPSCVAVEQLASQYKLVWAMCGVGWGGVWLAIYLSTPSFARAFVFSFPIISMCAQTWWMEILCVVQYI